MRSQPTAPLRHTGEGGCNPIDRLQPVSRKPGRFGELLWYRLRKHKLASVQKLFFWTRDSRDRTKLLRSFPWAELDYILLRRCDEMFCSNLPSGESCGSVGALNQVLRFRSRNSRRS